jgi:glyoxylase-like metal-dependent hydrolase (beta-lactamase superfamily II)
MEIIPGVFMISSTVFYQYLIAEAGDLTLIDTGLPNNANNIVNYLTQKGFTLDQVKRILITHADGDHYGSVNALLEMIPSIRVMTSQIEADAMRVGKLSRELRGEGFSKLVHKVSAPLFAVKPTRVNEILQPGQVLPQLNGLEVLDTKGHTPGHISFFSASTGVLFSGDSIAISNKELHPSSGGNTWNAELAKISFEKELALKPKYICGGHGFYQ